MKDFNLLVFFVLCVAVGYFQDDCTGYRPHVEWIKTR